MSLKGLRFTLEVDGLAETATAVVRFNLAQYYSVPFQLNVDIASGLSDLTATNFLEKNAVLTVWQGTEAQRTVTGIVTAVTVGENNHWQTGYHLTISPPLWRCGLRQNFRIFQQQDIQTISATLLNENGITEWTPVFYDPHPAREFCAQYGESDLAFLVRLWAEEGIFFFDWHASEGTQQKLVLCDDKAGISGKASLPFNPNTATGVTTECISQFRYHAQIRPSSVETEDYTFKSPNWQGYYNRAGENLNGQLTQYEIFDYPGRFKDEQHGRNFARYRIEGWRNDAEMATGCSNSPKLWPGKCFTLTGHPSDSSNRKWQVTRSVLIGEQPQALHGSKGVGTTLNNRFDVIPADRTWRPGPLPKPKVDGPQSAVVTGPPGEEIFCDEHGRVRVSQAWAGAGFGNLAIPRVGQEVIVDFLNGDPDQPIIMGRTYHQDNRSPGGLPGTKTQMTIRSKTYKGSGFNELKFDDATGKEQVYIHAQKNMDTEVLNDRTTKVKHDHTETITNNQKINVGVGQTLNVGSKKEAGHDQKVTVANDQNTTVVNDQITEISEGNKTTDINQGDQKITLHKGTQTITVKKTISVSSEEKIEFICGDSSITLLKNGEITLKGKIIKNIAENEYQVNTKILSADGSVEQVLTGGILKLNP
ncbi:type VI secretion system tip protein TssI/VgrG [Buttiauxella selenatireducens]|uniref:Type VI secretion system tip protein TssI/VgrG n=1 Tax=Buttiauxella selenatireducens TaxID=3073902 RepID=A0ABY9S4A5_9ENTR|nr:type VI secretion system tip protein TssI/VgrG [Buttiauxella sp. R73]WMY72333.1 type VI secretion system tip protein TssI/VgrG [Buttiauxella sp. R73]